MSHSFTMRDQQPNTIYYDNSSTPEKLNRNFNNKTDTIDSKGNIIRGRKIDSPQLVVVRELRDQEDLQDVTGILDKDILMQVFNSGEHDDTVMYRNKIQRDRTNSDQRLRNSRQQQHLQKNILNRKINKQQSKSQDNNAKKKSKSQTKQANVKNAEKQIINIENLQNLQRQGKMKNVNLNNATKSQREIRSSMGFHELLNQLDKDISLQQSNQFDLKNKTSHDLLKLELSGIRRQNSSGANIALQNNFFNKSQEKTQAKKKNIDSSQPKREGRSKSNERSKNKKQEKVKKLTNSVNQTNILPKSILKKSKPDFVVNDQTFQYPLIEITPDRNQQHQGINSNSFLHSEHGRQGVIAQINQPNQSIQNGKQLLQQVKEADLQPTNINILFSKIKVLNKQAQSHNNVNQHPHSSSSNKQRNTSTSPERIVKEFKSMGNIDKLVRDNLKKIKNKEDEERLQKLNNEDIIRRKKEQLEIKNDLVRKLNKEKIYKKSLNQNNLLQNITNLQQFTQDQEKFLKFNKQQWDKKINLNIQSRDAFIQKTSQTQKIDFEKIKQTSKAKNLKIKNHRKSYGLEFIDIKKEIQEELKTIEQRYKNNLLASKPIPIVEETHEFITDLDIPTQDFRKQQVKRLKVKSQKKIQVAKNDTLPLNTDQFISERIQPVDKIIVVKKNKIRKFMKNKKKLIIIQKIKEQKEEIVKAIKMQENISKLNEFCKKKMEKQLQKKRNATIQYNDEKIQLQQDISKISGRRIVFDNVELKKTINPKIEDRLNDTFNNDNDSSRLSTEFYEEYYRLINSIKKEQQIRSKNSNQSKMDISSQNITQKSIKNLLSSPGNQSHSPITQLSQTQQHIFSPKQLTKKEKSQSKKPKSKSNLKHQDGLQLVNQNQQKSQQNLLQNAKLKNLQQSADTQQFLKLKERAESAPLLMNQANQSNKKKTKKKSPSQKLNQKLKQQKKKELAKKLNSLSEEERYLYIIEQICKIQNQYRIHLFNKGFYEQQQIDSNSNELQQSAQETVVHNYGSSSQELQNIDVISDVQQQKSSIDPDLQDRIEYDQEDDSEEDYDNEQQQSNNIIILNQQSNDDKKVVYMSNINSCSLPQTPKVDDSNKNKKNQYQKVFEYNPSDHFLDPKKLNSQPYSLKDNQVHQQISQKPSLKSHESEKQSILMQGDKLMFNDILDSAKDSNLQLEENKIGDYEMRMFTGSESLLREFKQNTPSQFMKKEDQHNDLLSNQTSVRQIISNQESVASQLSNNKKASSRHTLDQDSKQSQSNDINSHSSQSLFERNSFQQFTQTKLQQIMKNNEFLNIIEMREKALDYRKIKEKKFIKKMYKNKQYSPRTYVNKKEQLEKWVQVESEEIQKTKKQFEEEWQKTLRMIENTQKDVDSMRQKMKIQIDNNQKHNLQFNSQSSRNSSSSFNTISRQEPRKSILEQEDYQPLSQRSVRYSMSSSKVNHDKYQVIKDLKQSDISITTSKRQSPKLEQKDEKQDNLIDFLEQSWLKNQQKQVSEQLNDSKNRDSIVSKQGIFIEDQKNDMNSSQISDNVQKQMFDYIQDSDDVSQNLITERRVDATISNIVQQFQNHDSKNEERPLTRSRSQQDLSDLLKKSKLNFNDIDLNSEEEKQANLDSYRYDPRQTYNNDQNEIKIQENMFEDSSNRYSKGKNYYNDMNDLQSNDSLLNESELNNYFQDQKFSIEDFKSLDKRKIISQNINEDEDENLLGRIESQINLKNNVDFQKEEDLLHETLSKNLVQSKEQQLQAQKDFIDNEPSFTNPRRQQDTNDLNSLSPDKQMQTAFMHHQQAFLFQNTKPGENIKISDILRKNQSMIDPTQSNSFQLGIDTSQLLFQNTQINQSMVVPQLQPLMGPDYSALADQITEDILKQLLSTETIVAKRKQDQSQNDNQVDQIIPEPAADVFIIDAHINEKENRRENIEFRMRIVVEQDLIRVENYVNEVTQALQQAELQYLTMLAHNPSMISTQESNYHRQFLQVLTTPIRRNELDLLNQLQTSEIGSYDHFETAMDLNSNPILPIDLYLDIERQREESQIRNLYQNGVNDVDMESSVLQESTHIHNKSIFDALNESLMKFRPYGIQGEPMPWSNKNRRLQTKVDTNSVDTERLFFMVKQDVMRWAQTFSGCAPSPIFLFRRQMDDTEHFDDELFQETRERRLAAMLATEVVENEHQWLNYEFEEAQVKIDLSDMILEHLVEEVAVFLNQKHGIEIQE